MTADDLDRAAVASYASDYCRSANGKDDEVVAVCEEYEAECDARGVAPIYDEATYRRLGSRVGLLMDANDEADGMPSDWVLYQIKRDYPLMEGSKNV